MRLTMSTPKPDAGTVAISPSDIAKEKPHNIAIEQALLAALMNIEEAYDLVSSTVVAEDFYGERHRHIFRCIAHLASVNHPYDVLSVHDALARQDLLALAGGESYLMQIEQSTGTLFNLAAYAEKVKELATYRKLIDAANNMLSMAYHPKKQSLSDILDSAEAQIFAINESLNHRQGQQGLKEGYAVVQSVVDQLQALQAREIGALLGLDTSFEELNNKTQGLQNGDLIVLAARPAMGKTSFAINLAQSVLQQQLPVVVFSMEMSAEAIMMRLLSAWGSINQGNLRSGQMTPDEWARFNNGVTHMMNTKLYIDDRNNLPPSEVRSVCRKIAKDNPETGLGLIVVDYLQLMRVPGMENNRVLEIGEISRSLKALAREMNCPVIALSQLSRGPEQRPNKRPMASDLRESGSIEQDADLILFIYRDEVYNKERADNKGLAEIIIGKNRNGPIGTVVLAFEGQFTRFSNLTYAVPDSYEMPDEE